MMIFLLLIALMLSFVPVPPRPHPIGWSEKFYDPRKHPEMIPMHHNRAATAAVQIQAEQLRPDLRNAGSATADRKNFRQSNNLNPPGQKTEGAMSIWRLFLFFLDHLICQKNF